MDQDTVAVYQANAPEWRRKRGTSRDNLGTRFRSEAGPGLVADLGCGTGRYLGQIGPPVIGLDATAAMLSEAAAQHAVPLVQADLEALPFGEQSLFALFARHSYLHLPKERFKAALRDSRRVLVPGGLLMLTLVSGSYEGHGLPRDDFPGRFFACWQPEELTAALTGAGFTSVRIESLPREHGDPDLLARAVST